MYPVWMEEDAREALSKMHGQKMLSRIVDLMLMAYDRGVEEAMAVSRTNVVAKAIDLNGRNINDPAPPDPRLLLPKITASSKPSSARLEAEEVDETLVCGQAHVR